MKAYLDTSALLKLYVDEEGSHALWQWLEGSSAATCRVTWAEAMAALFRREREGRGVDASFAVARARLAQDWPLLHVIDLTQALVERAGELAGAFSLRGYDAVQLAAGEATSRAAREPVSFLCFDRRLNRAARILGLQLPEGVPV